MIEYLQSSLLGLVEGLTEFIPVSSTGHLIVVGQFLGFKGPLASTFDIFIQLGAILAVLTLYRGRFRRIVSLNDNTGFAGSRGLSLLFLTTLPAGLVGFVAHDFIIANLFNPATVSIALALGGIAIIFSERLLPKVKKTSIDQLDWKDSLAIGISQSLSLFPGVSRSAATILGAMYVGIERKTAAEYSFLAAVPIMFSASLYDLYKSVQFLSGSDAIILAIGFIVSFVSAWLSVKFFLRYLSSHTMSIFGWYRIIIAPVIFLLLG